MEPLTCCHAWAQNAKKDSVMKELLTDLAKNQQALLTSQRQVKTLMQLLGRKLSDEEVEAAEAEAKATVASIEFRVTMAAKLGAVAPL